MAGNLPQMLTANRLTDGAVVYLGQANAWVEDFRLGALWRDEEGVKSAEATGNRAVDALEIIGPYLIDAREGASGPEPVSVRERIRADRGPTFTVDAGSWTGRIAG